MGFRSWLNRGMWLLAGLCAGLTVLPLVAILAYVMVKGFGRLDLALFTQLPPGMGLSGGGVANALLGTLLVVSLATLLAVPVGVLAGIYLAEQPPSSWTGSLRVVVNVLSGLPSILAGIFAYGLLVASGVVGFSAIAGALALGVLMVPLLVRTTDEAMRQVPLDIRWAAASVGASRTQAMLQVVLPAALPGISTGVLLAIARATGETAPLLFTALNSNFFPTGLREPTPTLSVLIYNFALAPFPPQQELAWAASLLLVLLVLLTRLLAQVLLNRL